VGLLTLGKIGVIISDDPKEEEGVLRVPGVLGQMVEADCCGNCSV